MSIVYENYDYENPILTGENGVEVDYKGKWKSEVFNNPGNLCLELACGRGEYTLALAKDNPNENFMGIDVKGARIWRGAKNALEQNLKNVRFLRTRIEQVDLFFDKGEVDEIWITFPDPFHGKDNRKLTHHKFLDRYKYLLKDGGWINFKTDDDNLFDYSLKSINSYQGANILYKNDDIYADELPFKELDYKTHYEKNHLAEGKKIKFIRFTL